MNDDFATDLVRKGISDDDHQICTKELAGDAAAAKHVSLLPRDGSFPEIPLMAAME